MGGLFVNDGTGYIHDCDEPHPPATGLSFRCPECETTWFSALNTSTGKMVWVSAETGRSKP